MRRSFFLLWLLSGLLSAVDQKPLVINQTTGRTENLQVGNTLLLPNLTAGRVVFSSGTSALIDAAGFSYSTANGLESNRGNGVIDNTFVGRNAGNTTVTGSENTAFGSSALANVTSSLQNTAFGSGSLAALTTADSNTGIGRNSLQSLQTIGADNVAVGENTLRALVNAGLTNTAIGASAGAALTSGNGNIFLGAVTGNGITSSSNTLYAGGSGANSRIQTVYLGAGPTDSTPATVTVNVTGGSGADTSGARLNFAGGISTGAGVGGSIVLQTSPATGSSSTPNTLADRLTVDQLGQVSINTVGRGLSVKEGSNAKMGTSVLVAGTVTVSTTAVTATSRVFLTSQVDGGTVGFVRVSTRTAGTSFVITSSLGTDTSTIAWFIVEPSP